MDNDRFMIVEPKNSLKILIADDSEQVRKSLSRLLSILRGIEIIGEAVDGRQAIDKTRKLKPDILILDMKMPNGSGLDVLHEIAPDKEKLRVIMLTNYANEQFRNESLKAGADYFFDKSTEFEKVFDVIKNRINQENQ